MKSRILTALGCAAALWFLVATAHGQATKQTCTLAASGVCNMGNAYGSFSASFEEIPNGGPSGVSVTVQGCMTANTCDSASDTNTSTSATIRAVTFAKAYDYFKITVGTLTGGTSPTMTINSLTTTARNPSASGGAVSSVFTRTGAVVAASNDYTCAQVTNCPTTAVTSAASLTNTAIMTGAGSQASQTPSATATLSSGGNMSLPGTLGVTGHLTFEGVTSTGAQGTGALVFATSPTLTTPVLGAATATTINKLTFTTPATGSTLTIIDGKTLTATNTMDVAKTAGVQGGLPWYDTTTSQSASALLASGGLVLGGGSGAAPNTSANFNASGSTLNIGTTGATGILNINGTTAGVAAPITTLATGLTLVFPTGTTTNPGLNFVSNSSNSGWIGNGSGGVNWISAGAATGLIGANGFAVQNSGSYRFNRSGSAESGIGDETGATGGAMISADSTAIGNEGAFLRSANVCRITADVSLTVNTPNSFCSFSLPGVAKAWAFTCDILWNITAGSGTNTMAIGVNPSQTPTGTTNALASVTTATSGTQTNGSAAISASGATNILTGATYTPAATVLPARITGTLLASATAGTFAITASANGTTATANVKAGTQCQLQ